MLKKDKDEVFSGNLYVLDGDKKKIYPFIFEDLNDSYNIDRFPDRVRRKPKEVAPKKNLLLKYTDLERNVHIYDR